MNALLVGLIACVLTQTDRPMAAPEEPVYVITLNDTGETLYGFVDEKDWERGTSARVRLDIPWSSQPVIKHVNPAKATREREWSGARERRLAEQADEVGLERVGERYYPAEDVKWARKAREMAKAAAAAEAEKFSQPPRESEPVAAGAISVSEPEQQPSSFAQRWGKQMAILVGALVLLGVTVKLLVLA